MFILKDLKVKIIYLEVKFVSNLTYGIDKKEDFNRLKCKIIIFVELKLIYYYYVILFIYLV